MAVSSSIPMFWQSCHVQVVDKHTAALADIPLGFEPAAAQRLEQLGATRVTVHGACTVRFRAKQSVVAHLVAVFPCCPVVATP